MKPTSRAYPFAMILRNCGMASRFLGAECAPITYTAYPYRGPYFNGRYYTMVAATIVVGEHMAASDLPLQRTCMTTRWSL